MPTSTELKYLISDELGFECDPKFSTMFDRWYGIYSTSVSESVLYLTLYRQTLYFLLSKARNTVDIQIGFDEIKKSQEFKNILDMIKIVNAQIVATDPSATIPELVSVSGESSFPDVITEFVELKELLAGI